MFERDSIQSDLNKSQKEFQSALKDLASYKEANSNLQTTISN